MTMKRKSAASKKIGAGATRGTAGTADRVVVSVDTSLYPLDAIYGAAYVFLGKAYVFLEKDKQSDRIVRVTLSGKSPLDKKELEALGGEFGAELLNQAMRCNIDESARKIREYIVVRSHFGQGGGAKVDIEGLLDQTLKEAFDEDPLDIAVPWEEKYGAKPAGEKNDSGKSKKKPKAPRKPR